MNGVHPAAEPSFACKDSAVQASARAVYVNRYPAVVLEDINAEPVPSAYAAILTPGTSWVVPHLSFLPSQTLPVTLICYILLSALCEGEHTTSMTPCIQTSAPAQQQQHHLICLQLKPT